MKSKKNSNTLTGGEKFLLENPSPMEANGTPLLTNEELAKEARVDYELVFRTLAQKLAYLETGIKNLIVSSGKVLSLVASFKGDDELALRVYESDKRSLESSLKSFKGFVAMTYENIKTTLQGARAQDHNRGNKISAFYINPPQIFLNPSII